MTTTLHIANGPWRCVPTGASAPPHHHGHRLQRTRAALRDGCMSMLQTQQLVPLPTPTTPTNNHSNEPMSDQWPTVTPNNQGSASSALDKANRNGGGLLDPSHMSSPDQSPADQTHHHPTQPNSALHHHHESTSKSSPTSTTTTDPYEYLPTPPTTPLDSPDGSGSLTPKLPTPAATATYSASTFNNATAHMAVEANTTSTSNSAKCAVGTGMMMMPLTIFSLPNETLDRIFSFIPRECLPTVMRAHSRCHVLAERLLYFKIQHIHLFEPLLDEEEETHEEGGNRANNMNEGSEYGAFGNGDAIVNGDSARRRSGNDNVVVGGVTALGLVEEEGDWRGGGATTTTPPRSRPARNKHWQCLWTLAHRRSAASAVRHFAIKSISTIAADTNTGALTLISRVLSSLDNLCSLQLEVDPWFERALLSTNPRFSSTLTAINVRDPRTALYICNAPAASGEGQALPPRDAVSHCEHHVVSRPITTLRIDWDKCHLDAEMMASLLTSLTFSSSTPVQRLQLAVWCESVAGFIRILDMIAKQLPFLATLGIHIRSPRPIVAESPQDLTRQIAKALAPLTQLQTFSLASTYPSLSTTREDAEVIAKECQQIKLIELQWVAWGLDQDPSRNDSTTTTTTGATSEWKPLSGSPNFHPFVRRRWVYEHAYLS